MTANDPTTRTDVADFILTRCLENAKDADDSPSERGELKGRRWFGKSGALPPVSGRADPVGHDAGPDASTGGAGGYLFQCCPIGWESVRAGQPLPRCSCGKDMVWFIVLPERVTAT